MQYPYMTCVAVPVVLSGSWGRRTFFAMHSAQVWTPFALSLPVVAILTVEKFALHVGVLYKGKLQPSTVCSLEIQAPASACIPACRISLPASDSAAVQQTIYYEDASAEGMYAKVSLLDCFLF